MSVDPEIRANALRLVMQRLTLLRETYLNAGDRAKIGLRAGWTFRAGLIATKDGTLGYKTPLSEVRWGLVRRFPEENDEVCLTECLVETESDPAAFDAACEIAGSMLFHGDTLPMPLARFAAEVLGGTRRRPSGRAGPNPETGQIRKTIIVDAIRLARSTGLKATRNEASSHEDSACDVVSEALAQLEMDDLSYERVRLIWFNRDRRVS